MGFEIHLTRADSWLDSTDAPISVSEWEAFASGRSDLRVSGSVSFEEVGEQPVYSWVGPAGEDVSLYWYDHRIEVTGVSDERCARALVPLAQQLSARVVDDDDEDYG